MPEDKEKVDQMHVFLSYVGRDLPDVLNVCSDEELYVLNAESYSIYSAIFAEVKMRVASHVLQQAHDRMYEVNPWTSDVGNTRIGK